MKHMENKQTTLFMQILSYCEMQKHQQLTPTSQDVLPHKPYCAKMFIQTDVAAENARTANVDYFGEADYSLTASLSFIMLARSCLLSTLYACLLACCKRIAPSLFS